MRLTPAGCIYTLNWKPGEFPNSLTGLWSAVIVEVPRYYRRMDGGRDPICEASQDLQETDRFSAIDVVVLDTPGCASRSAPKWQLIVIPIRRAYDAFRFGYLFIFFFLDFI